MHFKIMEKSIAKNHQRFKSDLLLEQPKHAFDFKK